MQQSAGQREQARQTFAEALATAREAIANPGRANGPFSPSRIIVEAQVQTGQFADAISVGRLLETAEQRGRTLGEIAAAMVNAGQAKQAAVTLTEALAALRKDNDTEEKAANLAMIAATQAKAGLIEQAAPDFRRGDFIGPQRQVSGRQRPWKLGTYSGCQHPAERRLSSRCPCVARAIKYPGEKASALIEIAGAQIDGGHADQAAQSLAEAMAAARAMEDEDRRGDILQGIAETQVKAGFLDAGLSTARDIENPHHKAYALLAVAGGPANGELKKQAPRPSPGLAAARRISKANLRRSALRNIAAAQSKAGLAERR